MQKQAFICIGEVCDLTVWLLKQVYFWFEIIEDDLVTESIAKFFLHISNLKIQNLWKIRWKNPKGMEFCLFQICLELPIWSILISWANEELLILSDAWGNVCMNLKRHCKPFI